MKPVIDRATVPNSTIDLRDRIGVVHDTLTALPSLAPGPVVNSVFAELVRICEYRSGEDAGQVLDDPRVAALIPRLRQLCAAGEFQLERAWARQIVDAVDPDTRLAAFPYWDNYQELTTLERHTLAGVGLELGRVRRICFLGGGPLPLSALLMSRDLAVPVDVVDVSEEAVALGAAVARRLSMPTQAHFHQADAEDFAAVADSDVVVLAALVGLDHSAKRHILQSLSHRMRPGSMLIARSAHGLRTLLYPPLELDGLTAWQPLAVLHPFTAVVNSVLVLMRR